MHPRPARACRGTALSHSSSCGWREPRGAGTGASQGAQAQNTATPTAPHFHQCRVHSVHSGTCHAKSTSIQRAGSSALKLQAADLKEKPLLPLRGAAWPPPSEARSCWSSRCCCMRFRSSFTCCQQTWKQLVVRPQHWPRRFMTASLMTYSRHLDMLCCS